MKKTLVSLLPAALLGAADAALAAGGTGASLQNNLESVIEVAKGLGVALATGAFIWAGFKVFFKGANISDVSGPVVGSILVGAAPWLAGMFITF